MNKLTRSLAIVALLCLAGFACSPALSADAATVSVVASADAYVASNAPDANFGSGTTLQADASPVNIIYLKFDVTNFTAAPDQVLLHVYTRSTGTTPVKLAVEPSSWTESGITYNNRPALGTLVANSGALTAGTWISIDVTKYVQSNGTYSFALTTGATAVRLFDSRESANAPYLEVTAGAPPSSDPVVVGAGDVACAPTEAAYNGGAGTATACHMGATAQLVQSLSPASVLMLGDGQYNSGTLSDYKTSYGASWGAFKSLTDPTVGNHEYGTTGAGGYFTYFGNLATPRQPTCTSRCDGYYSYDVGAWHIVSINAECTRINGGTGCAVGSPQETWLKADLAAHPNVCTLVYGHRPRWSSNSFASADIAPLVADMYDAGVDIYLSGHAHSYERFAPQDPSGKADATSGIRQFVVGTGGENFTGFGTTAANSQLRKTNIFGVMKLALHPQSYDFRFVPDPATPFSDSGSGTCH
ncbi:DNRLRE domain-containing protein [Terrabacter sp. BE26]|uniref:CBM96 family carbohydrate-binding protein n=1 Tax=Terrabacter sp. BE26 TaxID=2898152 RepID=UPI0035BE8CA7